MTKDQLSATVAEILQICLDRGKIPITDMVEILEFYVREMEELAHAVEVEDKLVAKSLRIAGRLT